MKIEQNKIQNDEQQNLTNNIPTRKKIDTKDDLKKMFEEDFASGINYVYVNTLDQEIGFKEITVLQQKTLSRITLANENRKDVIYDAQCQIINNVCQTEGFDIYNLTEFDRTKLLMALYQQNMFQSDVTFTCKHCGCENKYKLNFDNTIKRLDDFDVSPKTYEYENTNMKYTFEISYPIVKLISQFHKLQFMKQNKNLQKRQNEKLNDLSTVDYINLYISKVNILNKKTGKQKEIDFKYYSLNDIDDIIQMFPQDVLYSDKGVINYILKNFISNMNSIFDKHPCINCGELNEESEVNSVTSFL